MTFQVMVSPDFSPEHIAGWYVFNTWLQRSLGVRCHLHLPDDFESLHCSIENGSVDLIYANAANATKLVRERGFLPLVAAAGQSDEAVVAVAAESALHELADLKPGMRIALTQDPDVRLIGMMMLEPVDLSAEAIASTQVASYVLVAKQLLTGKAEAGFFLKKAFFGLSAPTQRRLRVLVSSDISVMRHTLLAGPRFLEHAPALRQALLAMAQPANEGQRVLQALGLPGWEPLGEEDTEFMIDLMDALQR